MTHSSTLYEREVGDGLVVNSEKKKRNRETHFPPQGITYQTSNRKKKTKKKQLVPWKSTAGKVTDGHTAGFHPQTQ